MIPLICDGGRPALSANEQGASLKFASIREYEAALLDLAARYDGAFYQREGTSAVGDYPLYVVRIGDPALPPIMLEAELHGRHEWRSTHFLLDYLRRLPELNPRLLERHSIIAVPMSNPYGYFNGTYHNGHAYSDGENRPFAGVNLNRQFSYQWEDCPRLAEDYWTNDLYKAYRTADFYAGKGPVPYSEPEARLLRDLVLTHRPAAYIALHVMGVNPAISAENRGITVWYGPSQPHDILALLRDEIVPAVDARHEEKSIPSAAGGGVLPATYPGLSQSYVWTRGRIIAIPI